MKKAKLKGKSKKKFVKYWDLVEPHDYSKRMVADNGSKKTNK